MWDCEIWIEWRLRCNWCCYLLSSTVAQGLCSIYLAAIVRPYAHADTRIYSLLTLELWLTFVTKTSEWGEMWCQCHHVITNTKLHFQTLQTTDMAAMDYNPQHSLLTVTDFLKPSTLYTLCFVTKPWYPVIVFLIYQQYFISILHHLINSPIQLTIVSNFNLELA